MLVFKELIFLLTFSLIHAQIYLYQTQDGLELEFYDCVSLQPLYYCRRPTSPINLARDHHQQACQLNGGRLHSFSDLQSQQINTSTILHQWRSSIERVEQYSRYLTNPTSDNDGQICQCIDSASFGKNCEYRLSFSDILEQTLDWQLITRYENPNEVQIHGDIVRYTTLTCNSTLLGLDWRDICDGIQQCDYGIDEENCDLLEMNVCDDDEYRCMNGMCIPDKYFLDGEFDCLDWSDEIQYKKSEECAGESVSSQCDDHICPPNEWSCGDGQCIRDRLAFTATYKYAATCRNRRDQYFMCENSARSSWTMPNGRCHEGTEYETSFSTDCPQEEWCEYLLRCHLSRGAEKHCPDPTGPFFNDEIDQKCLNRHILYPRGPLITSFIYTSYEFRLGWEFYSTHDYHVASGTINCRHSFLSINQYSSPRSLKNAGRTIHNDLCRKGSQGSFTETQRITEDCHYPNESTGICDEWNSCMSITRLKDGFANCLDQQDEREQSNIEIHRNCLHVQRHRFHCSSKEPTCLNVMALGNGKFDCISRFDESWFGTGSLLSMMRCNNRQKDQCPVLRDYIKQSWMTTYYEQVSLNNRTNPFRSYCDTFWDIDSSEDENRTECQQWWVCARDQSSCRTKQCIYESWVVDSEWDCPHAEDEAMVLDWLVKLMRSKVELQNMHHSQSSLLLNICNHNNLFLCLSPHTSVPQFDCINQSRIGDGHIDCAGATDERNTFKHCSQSSILGYHFLCVSTNTCIPYYYHCQPGYRCSNRIDDHAWCSLLDGSATCPNVDDFRCLTGRCVPRGRCNHNFECDYLEDEYMCDYPSAGRQTIIRNRANKQHEMRIGIKSFELPRFPSDAKFLQNTTTNNPSTQVISNISTFHQPSSSAYLTAYQCNRGIGVLSIDNSTFCFCPPQYFGDRCQYHNDRLSVLLHLKLSHSMYTSNTDPNVVLKLLVFFQRDQTLMTHEFHVRPGLENDIDGKKKFDFFYSHASIARQQREARYLNRSDILNQHPYSLQIDLYQLHGRRKPILIYVWKYPIFFDYLPVYRFSKVLHLRRINESLNACSSNSCPTNAECYPLMNNHSRYICVCKANYSGEDCSEEDQACRNDRCASGSLCKSNYRAKHRGNDYPYCICPVGRLGDRCDIVEDSCEPNPCQHRGSCLPSAVLNETTCLCTKEYYGNTCQLKKRFVQLSINTSERYAGVVIQYFDVDFASLDLYLVHQQTHISVPQRIEYYYIQTYAPNIVLAKCYSSYDDITPQIYLLSSSTAVESIEAKTIISDFNRCQHVHQRFKDSSPIRYHSYCYNNASLLCFRDDHYLCVCVDNHTRVECFIYDYQLDRCSHCLHDGRCLRGEISRSDDFVCLCSSCYSGGQCQFSSKAFTFTLDQIFYTDLTISHQSKKTVVLLILFSLLSFFFAIPNNLFLFVTFRQKSCLRNGIGHYLLTLSMISQFNLTLFVARLTHLSLNITNQSSSSTINTILCKLFNYFLVSSSRMVYWLSTLIAIERVYMTLILNGQWLKQPRIARRLILLTIVVILFTTIYEFLFYRSLSIVSTTKRAMCILQFPHDHQSQWITVHFFIPTLHSVVPFLVNLCSTIIICAMVVKKKMNTQRTQRSRAMNFLGRVRFIFSVLIENQELVLGPGLTLIPQLFSLPLIISSFTLNCQNIENNWIRYLLMCSYWISFTPQMTSFFLYISPSSFYCDEWHKTKLGKTINSKLRWHQSEAKTMVSSTLVSKSKQETK